MAAQISEPVMNLSEEKWQSLLSVTIYWAMNPCFFLPIQVDLQGSIILIKLWVSYILFYEAYDRLKFK